MEDRDDFFTCGVPSSEFCLLAQTHVLDRKAAHLKIEGLHSMSRYSVNVLCHFIFYCLRIFTGFYNLKKQTDKGLHFIVVNT